MLHQSKCCPLIGPSPSCHSIFISCEDEKLPGHCGDIRWSPGPRCGCSEVTRGSDNVTQMCHKMKQVKDRQTGSVCPILPLMKQRASRLSAHQCRHRISSHQVLCVLSCPPTRAPWYCLEPAEPAGPASGLQSSEVSAVHQGGGAAGWTSRQGNQMYTNTIELMFTQKCALM